MPLLGMLLCLLLQPPATAQDPRPLPSLQEDVVVYIVAAGDPSPFERRLVEQAGGGLIPVEATADLTQVFSGILREFRQRYLLSYSPRGVPLGGWHPVEVRVKTRRGLTVKARAGYQR